MSHSHSHDSASHSHAAADHGHTHEILDGPGSFNGREMPMIEGRDWEERSFTVGIGGYAYQTLPNQSAPERLHLCWLSVNAFDPASRLPPLPTTSSRARIASSSQRTMPYPRECAPAPLASIFAHATIHRERIVAVETGGCPHAAVREDISVNLLTLTNLHRKFDTDLLLIESGGDNLAANYSRELADFIIYVIDVAGGDKIPRKGGPGITQSDLLVVNKIDLAEAVGADISVMERDSRRMREGGPTIFAVVKRDQGVDAIVELILSAWKASGAVQARKEKFNPTLMQEN
ncbi:hypothetical protein IAQ61_009134 [Plenodomus lingam]|uniref:uncharacterized protein n=1 Tax=Leptosphaeria maculans TaxID=5022 RepID=UPI0033177E34|nr:hypothetical protein IAQ61_009134 [Plenodomus lingam]